MAETALGERRDQRGLVDHAPARNVDERTRRPESIDDGSRDQMTGLGAASAGDHQIIALSRQFDDVGDVLVRHLGLAPRTTINDAHAERAAARERNIPVTNTPGILTDEVADLAIGLMLASARQIVFADRYVRDGSWGSKGPIPLGRSVGGKTMGVIGLGGIGRAIADRGAAFRMRVIYTGPRRKPHAPYEYVGDVVELARQSDYLMVACKGGPDTHHLVSAAVIDALGPNGTLINVARGSVVDEAALVAALVDGRLAGAGLDVFADEPNVPEALLTLDNVVLLPHVGSGTVETRAAMEALTLRNLDEFLASGRLVTPVVEPAVPVTG